MATRDKEQRQVSVTADFVALGSDALPARLAARNAANLLNWRELLSVKAMTSYVAHNQNVNEDRIRALLTASFEVDGIDGLRRDQFERVIAFLVDLNCDMMMN